MSVPVTRILLIAFLISAGGNCLLSKDARADSRVTGSFGLMADSVLTGADQVQAYFPLLKGKRVGVTGNHTSTVGEVHLVDTLLRSGIQVIKVFCPEHGFRGEAEAGKSVVGGHDSITGLPVISLYGASRKPSAWDLDSIDIMVFDIQDVGARFYTYISTLHYVMEACAENGIPVLVLDRPNPNGHYVDGPVLKPGFSSFIGMHPVALVHGMTIGEYASMINNEGWLANGISCDLLCVPLKNYTHCTFYALPDHPSPNLQDMDAVYLYPSICLLEGTVASVGRGTDFPFRIIGHPAIVSGDISFTPRSIPGKSENPRWQGTQCSGWMLSGTFPDGSPIFDSLDLTWLIRMYAELKPALATDTLITPNPDSIEDTLVIPKFFTSSFDRLAGNSELRMQILKGVAEDEIRRSWREDLIRFSLIRSRYLLYPQ